MWVWAPVPVGGEAEPGRGGPRDAALTASLTKSEFMSNVGHELRNPRQSILGFSGLGQRRAKAHETLVGMFDDIHRPGKRMLALVNDLLDLCLLYTSPSPRD